jgi:hypothetical protein
MFMGEEQSLLVAVWVESINDARQAVFWNGYLCHKSATLRASSTDRKITFELETNPLCAELLEKIEHLFRYGFTVIEVPDFWRNEFNRPRGWRDELINKALEQAVQSHDGKQWEGTVAMYDEDLAQEVLISLNKSFPYAVTMIDLKHFLVVEPSDEVLLTALDALRLEGLVSGQPLREHQSGRRKLVAMANIQITADGRRRLASQSQIRTPPPSVVHGEQIINLGNAVAIGRNSVGTINQQQWATAANQVDLSQIVSELQTLRTELIKTAKTPADFQQLSIIAEAEQYAERQDGPRVMEALSKSGKWLFDFATHVGTDITAKLLAKAIGLEP